MLFFLIEGKIQFPKKEDITLRCFPPEGQIQKNIKPRLQKTTQICSQKGLLPHAMKIGCTEICARSTIFCASGYALRLTIVTFCGDIVPG